MRLRGRATMKVGSIRSMLGLVLGLRVLHASWRTTGPLISAVAPPRAKRAPHDSTESGTLSFLQYGSLSGYDRRLLLSHFRLRLQPIV
jgi:hypothetical protein